MPAPMISEGWAYALEPGIREWHKIGMEQEEDVRGMLFRDLQGTKAIEYFHTYGGFSNDSWDSFEKNLQIPTMGMDAGYRTGIEPRELPTQVTIRRKLYDDAEFNIIQTMLEEYGLAVARKRQTDGASVFNNAFSSSFLGGDGKALCANDHPNGPGTSTTQDNNFASTALTKANVSAVRLLMKNFKDDKGNLAQVKPDLLVVPKDLEETAWEIANTDRDPTSANNTSNFHYNKWNVIVWDYLDDTNNWFMIDSRLMKRKLLWIDRVMPSIYLKEEDNTVWANYIAYMRYSYGWTDWRWVAGCQG